MIELKVEKYSENNNIISVREEYVTTYTTKYIADISNSYLVNYRTLKAKELYDLKYKISIQFIEWAEKEKKQREKNNMAVSVEQQNEDYAQIFNDIDNILIHTLSIDDTVEWESLKSKEKFSTKKPNLHLADKLANWTENHKLLLAKLPEEPLTEWYTPQLSIWDKLIPSRKKIKIENSQKAYSEAHKKWEENYNAELKHNEIKTKKYNSIREAAIQQYKEEDNLLLERWNLEKDEFHKNKELQHKSIDELHKQYKNVEKEAIEDYCEIVLNKSQYPDFIQKDFEVEYNVINKILIIEYQLPDIGLFPTIKECKFIASRMEIKTTSISIAELNRIYDKALYDITLRTIHEIFEADTVSAIDAISFNGWVRQIDKATGNEINNCIISIQVQKEEFLKINLQNVDSKICFKGLKGVSSSKLYQTTPIQPILQIQKEDKRFIKAHDVSDQIDNSTNLAVLDWEDFEHLIREIFEKEFSTTGGEVKVTQASRDGGVDAVAFDPDPIRGGKIVIQAKRYTNTVSVSAVRDLYGTVMNEGATKGILVTTADYGPDAYSFAKDKPITLLNGSNLLFLLEKHGVHAKIDIKEAKLLNR